MGIGMKKGTNRNAGGQRPPSNRDRDYGQPVDDLREPQRRAPRQEKGPVNRQRNLQQDQYRQPGTPPEQRQQQVNNQRGSVSQEQYRDMFNDDLREEYEESVKKKSSIPIVPILLGVLLVIAIVLVVCLYAYFSNKESQPADDSTSTVTTTTAEEATTASNPSAVYDEHGKLISENGVYDLDGNVIDKDADSVGLPNFSDSEEGTTTERYFSSSDFVKDLNGLDVSAVYNVKSRSYIKDFVNYDAKRAIMDDGMELYWLEVTYKNKKYRVQCPFYIFKDLDDSGICVVEIEVLNLEGGEKIISYMQVVQNYDELINK